MVYKRFIHVLVCDLLEDCEIVDEQLHVEDDLSEDCVIMLMKRLAYKFSKEYAARHNTHNCYVIRAWAQLGDDVHASITEYLHNGTSKAHYAYMSNKNPYVGI
jgi:hypothetical protein